MKYLIDTANIEEIIYANKYFPIEGVTTNPSLIAKEDCDFKTLVLKIRNIIGNEKMLHVQTTKKTADEIVEEATLLKTLLGENFYIKIPISEEGLKATMMLKEIGIKVTMTAIFTPQQALISARAGADFVAPYVNRLDNISANGVGVVAEIAELFSSHALDTQILAASFKNVQQLNDSALAGAHSATISKELLSLLIAHPMTDSAITGFDKDWKSVYGESTIPDLL